MTSMIHRGAAHRALPHIRAFGAAVFTLTDVRDVLRLLYPGDRKPDASGIVSTLIAHGHIKRVGEGARSATYVNVNPDPPGKETPIRLSSGQIKAAEALIERAVPPAPSEPTMRELLDNLLSATAALESRLLAMESAQTKVRAALAALG